MDIAPLIEAAAERLRAVRVPKPRREAHRLWAWASRLPLGESYLRRGPVPEPGLVAAFDAAVARRVAGEPIAYIVGSIGFRHLELATDHRALIPRPETEGVVDLALARVADGNAADLCTGSGCLALALRHEGRFARVLATDWSALALDLARQNAARTRLDITFIRGDLGGPLRDASLDLLVANPPYLSAAEYGALGGEVRDWEPELALASGSDGLLHTRRILVEGRALLRPGGWLVMELDSTRADASARVAGEAGWDAIRVDQDLFGRARYLTARRG